MRTAHESPETLGREESLALLATVPLGRVAFTDRALPAVQPVDFVLDGDRSVIVRTGEDSELAAALRGAIVAFEADDIDPGTATGWSVTLVGQAVQVTDPAEIAHVERLRLHPWAPGRRRHFIRIRPRHVSGARMARPGRAEPGTARALTPSP
ncbi:pyridoxamine 5'-phosphate oxidase family protein [Actinomadura sp. 21ATH]|uniref:pyridoxamine 5'-phosphate oxidase family protein n=1 Tax=Actinomadura sp. 21ATH TaxID=1735444 RepID=UPI0035C18D60